MASRIPWRTLRPGWKGRAAARIILIYPTRSIAIWLFFSGMDDPNMRNGLLRCLAAYAIFLPTLRLETGLFTLLGPGAEQRMARDRRAPILYLRPFSADTDLAARSWLERLLFSGPSDELRLAGTLRKLGPFIAVGSPGDGIPPSGGASRLYVAGQDWQSRVLDLIDRSRFVILRVGTSQGVVWELETCISLCRPHKFLLYLPWNYQEFSEAETRYGGLADLISRVFPRGLPPWEPNALFLRFDRSWNPQFIRPTKSVLRLARRHYLIKSLAFALEELGVAREHRLYRRYLQRTWLLAFAATTFWLMVALTVALSLI